MQLDRALTGLGLRCRLGCHLLRRVGRAFCESPLGGCAKTPCFTEHTSAKSLAAGGSSDGCLAAAAARP